MIQEVEIDNNAKIILDYMKLNMALEKADVIIGLGSKETRVAERCAELYNLDYGKLVVFSGGLGKITKHSQVLAEAEVFQRIAIKNGVPANKIMLEKDSTNTGENIVLTEELLQSSDINCNSIIVVTKPYMERRAFAAFKKLWRNVKTKIYVTSPNMSYEDHSDGNYSKEEFINIMVGDLQRIKEFPRLGFQIEQDISEEVWSAYKYLVNHGYTKHLLKS